MDLAARRFAARRIARNRIIGQGAIRLAGSPAQTLVENNTNRVLDVEVRAEQWIT